MRFFYLLSVFILIAGCMSSEKKAYDSLLDKNNNQIKKKVYADREIAYLKNLSQFETESFDFITQQMKEVIKNYTNLKNQLIKIENKLDRLLVKINQENLWEKEKSGTNLLKEETEDSFLFQEEITDDSNIIPEEEGEEETDSEEEDSENDLQTQVQNNNSETNIQ